MFARLETLKNLIKTKSYHIDYPLFRLHYQVTASLILAYCLILSAKVLFGDTIDCRARGDRGTDNFYDNLCYSQGTYTKFYVEVADVIRASNASQDCLSAPLPQLASTLDDPISLRVKDYLRLTIRNIHKSLKQNSCFDSKIRYLFPGIPMPAGSDGQTNQVTEYISFHRYYQYIPILLFLQAVFFYIPHYLWKMWERGVVSSVCKELHDNRFKPEELMETKLFLVDYIDNCLSRNKMLVYKYYFCQVLLLINLILQIMVLDNVFNKQFITYGIDAIQYYFFDQDTYGFRGPIEESADFKSHVELNNPADFVFPKVTACTVEFLSQGGIRTEIQQYLCILPLNIFNDKFYLILWFWFLILFIVTLVQIIFDMMYLILPMLQRYLFDRKFGPYLSEERRRSASLPELFLLDLIGCNSDRYAFAAFLKRIDERGLCKNRRETHSLV